jgi:D-alanine-D-alanine ligase-like ATP-grasp enzyme
MSFGAVDFIVDENHEIYFIEINSAPGFTELSEHIYVDAFDRLKKLKKKEISSLI